LYQCIQSRITRRAALPDTLFRETAKEPLDDLVLLRWIRSDEFLLEPIVSTLLPKPPTWKINPLSLHKRGAPT
jgi:hypothetical protein